MPLRSVVVFVVGALVGFAGHIAWLSAHPGAPSARDRLGDEVGVSAAAAQPGCTTDWESMRAEVKQAVREVLDEEPRDGAGHSAVRAGAAGGGSAAAAPPPAETDDNKAAREAEAALLDAAIRAGRWTNQDVTKLRSLIPRMAPGERSRALAAISKAINDGQLKVDAVMPF
jgi:hypothetical protein